MRRCGLTDNDLYAQLRQKAIFDLSGLRYVLYEAKGSITVVPQGPIGDHRSQDDPPLVEAGIDGAAGYP